MKITEYKKLFPIKTLMRVLIEYLIKNPRKLEVIHQLLDSRIMHQIFYTAFKLFLISYVK